MFLFPDRTIHDAYAIYRFKPTKRFSASVQLNVSNVLNVNRTLYLLNSSNGTLRYAQWFNAPRKNRRYHHPALLRTRCGASPGSPAHASRCDDAGVRFMLGLASSLSLPHHDSLVLFCLRHRLLGQHRRVRRPTADRAHTAAADQRHLPAPRLF